MDLDETEFTRWREQAERTLETAVLASRGDRHEWACFLCEQAAQLALKGLLHGLGDDAWGHDLVVIEARAVAALGSAWPRPTSSEAGRLSRHYIPSRYPDAHPSGPPGSHYDLADADHSLADARTVMAAVDTAWQVLAAEEGE